MRHYAARATDGGWGQVDTGVLDDVLAGFGEPSDEQRQLVTRFCRFRHGAQSAIGKPGTGKTHAMRAAVAAWQAAGHRMLGTAVKADAARHLGDLWAIRAEPLAWYNARFDDPVHLPSAPSSLWTRPPPSVTDESRVPTLSSPIRPPQTADLDIFDDRPPRVPINCGTRVSGSATNGVADRAPGHLRRIVASHKLTAAAVACSVGFLFLNLALALGQRDGGRVTFPVESGLEVSLEPGEQRLIYMTADESSPWSFDFYPSDFEYTARGPDGLVVIRRVDHRRLLDGWRSHWSVGFLVADDRGGHRISCSGHRDAPLVLAAPARFTVGWASPQLGVVVVVLGSCRNSIDPHRGRDREPVPCW